ncbi:adenylate/guanylate cyclase domain-containing protein [Mycolicibacterium sp. BK556]|uniref:adenylate/guanylate cyclase domain-containing protein n=1 Tax=unclassified Mycolicibacterium TaxID=2636767 RepID=UPI00351CA4CD
MRKRACSVPSDGPNQRADCERMQRRAPARNLHWAESIQRRQRVLNIAAAMAAVVTAVVGILQILSAEGVLGIGLINLGTAAVFVAVPLLHRFGDILAALVFVLFAFVSLTFVGWQVGTDSGIQFYYLVSASLAVLVLGVEHVVMASTVVAIGAGLTVTLQFLVPGDTGLQPRWLVNAGFVITTVSACVMIFATVWYAMRQVSRAEAAMEFEYLRSEALLANILPASIADRLKDPARGVIADRFDDASILFADIAGFTERASQIPPAELVRFLDRLYTTFDRLVDKHGLEKIKTTGDSYMVVSGVPQPRDDHAEALANLALDMAKAVRDLRDPNGNPVPLRMGMAAGPVVAGVVGARRFFYDVWGDAVNVAARMETTDLEGHIQVPQDVYDRLRDRFVLEERGDVDVKGKGVMHTWYLVSRRPEPAPDSDRPAQEESGRVESPAG